MSAINYKVNNVHGGLTGIQLEFTDGHKVPLFETPKAMGRDKMKTIEVDQSKVTTKIAITTYD